MPAVWVGVGAELGAEVVGGTVTGGLVVVAPFKAIQHSSTFLNCTLTPPEPLEP